MIVFEKTNYKKRMYIVEKAFSVSLFVWVVAFLVIIADDIFHLSDFFHQGVDVVSLAAVVTYSLALVVSILAVWSQMGEWYDFSKVVKRGRIKSAKISYIGKTPDFSSEAEDLVDVWELDVIVEKDDISFVPLLNHAVLRGEVQRMDVVNPEIDIISKTIFLPYGYDLKNLSQERMDIESLREAVGK